MLLGYNVAERVPSLSGNSAIANWARSFGFWVRKGLQSLWRGALVFLEIIGLRAEQKADPEAQLARFRLYHAEFRRLLAANNSFLEITAELSRKLYGQDFLDRAYVKRRVVRAASEIHTMVESINRISGDRYPALRERFDAISSDLTLALEEDAGSASTEIVLDLQGIRAEHADLVGGKMANLGEIRNTLGLPTPDGFAVTTEAFRMVLEEGGLRSLIQSEQMDLLATGGDLSRPSREIQDLVRKAAIPPPVEREIQEALLRLQSRVGTLPRLAVRSSALGEDSDLSFAGQYVTLLDVPAEGLFDGYREVLASLFSPEALHYRLLHGIPAESAEMAVGVLPMVDAEAAGVAFSRDPGDPDLPHVLIQAVRGLGVALVEGKVSPEEIRVARDGNGRRVLRPSSGHSETPAVDDESEAVAGSGRSGASCASCLSDEQALELAGWLEKIEAHFQCPQDVEWALGRDGNLILLQARPLRLAPRTARAMGPLEGYRVLLKGGEAACPGAGTGPAVHMDENDSLERFPEGAVLVAPRSSPKFVRVMHRARAIVTDAGSTTGHMASLARELAIPALLNTRVATRSIPEGLVVTVDATNGFVYEGAIPELAETSVPGGKGKTGLDRPSGRRRTEETKYLEKALALVSPLHLTDPRSSSFRADRCRTLHDLARFIHEKSYAEMFGMGERLGDVRSASYKLDVFLPIDLYLLDLGGGFRPSGNGKAKGKTNRIKPEEVTSVPLKALLRGMLDPRIPRFGPRPMDLGGFLSIMMRHAVTHPEQDATFSDPCYALVSDCYLNYTARVGYHFSVVDTYCSRKANKNYINLLFRGGAAEPVRRNRRVRAIAGVLKGKGFAVEVRQDTVMARMNKASLEESVAGLETIGALLQFFRQMDAAMVDEESVCRFQEAFLRGDYDLGRP